jgi:hypothetical protein
MWTSRSTSRLSSRLNAGLGGVGALGFVPAGDARPLIDRIHQAPYRVGVEDRPPVEVSVRRRPLHPALRLCGLALLATVLFATAGGLVHRDHSHAGDAACVVHAWTQVAKAADVAPVLGLRISFHYFTVALPSEAPLVGERITRFALARAPPALV